MGPSATSIEYTFAGISVGELVENLDRRSADGHSRDTRPCDGRVGRRHKCSCDVSERAVAVKQRWVACCFRDSQCPLYTRQRRLWFPLNAVRVISGRVFSTRSIGGGEEGAVARWSAGRSPIDGRIKSQGVV